MHFEFTIYGNSRDITFRIIGNGTIKNAPIDIARWDSSSFCDYEEKEEMVKQLTRIYGKYDKKLAHGTDNQCYMWENTQNNITVYCGLNDSNKLFIEWVRETN